MKALVEGTVKNGGNKRTGEAVPFATGTTTDVTMTLVDLGGTVWNAATVTARFIPTPNTPGPYYWNGTTDWPKVRVAMSNPDGLVLFTAANNDALQDNLTIMPSGSMWQFIISPAATMPAVVFQLMIAGNSMDLSSIFTSQSYQIQNSLVQPFILPRAYQDSEVAFPPNAGGLYYNSAAHQVKVFTGGGGWDALLGGGWQVVPPGTTAASLATGGTYFAVSGFPDGPAALAGAQTVLVNFPEMQIMYSGNTDSSSFYYRIFGAGTWQGWYQVHGYSTISTTVDLNSLVETGTYFLGPGFIANGPSNITVSISSILEVFQTSGPYYTQRLMCPADPNHPGSLYHRIYDGNWSSWYMVQDTPV